MAADTIRSSSAARTALDTARLIIRNEIPAEISKVLTVVKGLKKEHRFGMAYRILEMARSEPSLTSKKNLQKVLQLVQQQALCLSKDTSLPARRHLDALELLRKGADLGDTQDKETLGIAGGIAKRMWQHSGRSRYLYDAISYYERGYRSEKGEDYGYTAINAAFLEDKIASHIDPEIAVVRCKAAKEIRESLVERLPALEKETDWLSGEWWYLVTVAEAFFRLSQFADAERWIKRGWQLGSVDEAEAEVTATQLAALARVHEALASVPWLKQESPKTRVMILREAFQQAPIEDLGSKFGIALSGGGFRASLYHIGILARLADEDLLRRIEVISCVSGGSIVGTHLYLELRHLLQEKPDEEITRQDYIDVVARLQKSFLAGVQRNLRTRILASPVNSLKVLFSDQTRTQYLGELIEEELLGRVEDGHQGPRWLSNVQEVDGQSVWTSDLLIQPADEAETFKPRGRNWRRRAKVPVLILNATTLNTGHLWQFAATWMGEPPGSIDRAVDRRERLRRLYYRDAPERWRKIRLGHAVAASACVPGLFEPFVMDGLYPNRQVSLVDGGVFDNQGVEGLRMLDCREIVVSDASAPLAARAALGSGRIDASVRSNAIGMSLVRERQHQSLRGLEISSVLAKLNWVHLVQDVKGSATVDWIDCFDPSDSHRSSTDERESIDERIAAIRTDLDAFSEVEAWALMTKGYRMTRRVLDQGRKKGETGPEDGDWDFLEIESTMNSEPGHDRAYELLVKQLDAGSGSFRKLWKLMPGLRLSSWILGAAAIGGLAAWGVTSKGSLAYDTLTLALGVLLILGLGLRVILRLVRTQASLADLLVSAVAIVAWLPARIQIGPLDRRLLRLGSMERLRKHIRDAADLPR